MSGAYLYGQFLKDFQALQTRVGVPQAELTGTAGLRSAGYTGVRNILGAALAQAHGGWAGETHNRYYRFESEPVSRIPSAIMGLIEADMHPAEQLENAVVERPSQRPQERITRDHFTLGSPRARVADSSAPLAPTLCLANTLPPGWSEEVRTPASGKAYSVYNGPDGQRAYSRVQAVRLHATQPEAGVDSTELIARAAAEEEDSVASPGGSEASSDHSAAAYADFVSDRERQERLTLVGPFESIVTSTGGEASSSSAPVADTPQRRLLPARVHSLVQRWSPTFSPDRHA